METTFKKQTVTRQQIQKALLEFASQYPDTDSYEGWLQKKSYAYSIRFEGLLYPPKHILSMATGIPTAEFNGVEQTNRVFHQLGFDVEKK
jgi:hypothetical protein